MTAALRASLDAAISASDYEGLRDEQARRRFSGNTQLLGIGLASYVERTAGAGRSEYGGIELLAGGNSGSNRFHALRPRS